jgi:hypothetical protein
VSLVWVTISYYTSESPKKPTSSTSAEAAATVAIWMTGWRRNG